MPVSDLVRTLLSKRGIEDADTFLNPSYDNHLHNPLLLSDMQKAIERFFVAIEKKEHIAVYTDFDCDGLGSATVFHDFLKKIGYQSFEIYMPHRDIEGYGFHASAVRKLCERGTTLIITADVGISGHEGVEAARFLGCDVIITDHHEVMIGAPNALAVVNPKLSEYPFPHLCGAAVAYKFVQAAIAEGKHREMSQFLSISEGWEKWLLDVVAIATIADMVPLVGENRALVHYGLRVLRQSRRVGLRALAESARLRLPAATEDDVGFSIAPRLNAASRMDNPELAFHLLTTLERAEADRLAKTLEQLNAKRKGVVASIVKEAKKRARERFENESITVLGDPSWKPALLGLAANSVMAERGGVVCLWGRDAAGNVKGSCRSDGSVSLAALFTEASGAFLQFGGHAHAGGFSVSGEGVHALQARLAEAMKHIQTKTKEKESVSHDVSLPLSLLHESTLRDISRLSPFGVGNHKPIFHVPESRVVEVRRFGKEKNHVEVTLECPQSGRRVRSFDFFKSPSSFTLCPEAGSNVRALVTLERDTFAGRDSLALRIIDFLPPC